jgi:uncharacterized protein YdhG (YjbR/CyaY superfamily)
MSATNKTGGFSEAEKQAMRERAAELKAEKGGKKKAEMEKAALDAIAAMPDEDRLIAERIHALVLERAPDLTARTWYGMPAYANGDGKVVCFFQAKSKFDSRYATFGFNDVANLDDGPMWPVTYAITEWTPEVEKQVASLIEKAVS